MKVFILLIVFLALSSNFTMSEGKSCCNWFSSRCCCKDRDGRGIQFAGINAGWGMARDCHDKWVCKIGWRC